ncbi:hypothetical protein WKH56_07340 [Priestia sp. SB1]|uniref:Uncharacterized protein n=1 Tax=Priestia aryabhattai TaxID=412384 RepID=A0AAX6NBN9_PRIAR|nr:hypothetical protein [Priestia aryabhattai]MDU9693207.1 hypothetical protein [Priestia aryabhattai]
MLRKQGRIQKSDYYDRVDIKIPVVMDERDKRIKYLHIPEEQLVIESILYPSKKEILIYLKNYFQVDSFPFSVQEKEKFSEYIKYSVHSEMRDYNLIFK